MNKSAFVLCALVLCNVAQAQDADALIAQARQEAQAKQYLDCLTMAQKAIGPESKNYKGYYYAAYALASKTNRLVPVEWRVSRGCICNRRRTSRDRGRTIGQGTARTGRAAWRQPTA